MEKLREYIRECIENSIENGYWYEDSASMSDEEIASDILEQSDWEDAVLAAMADLISQERKNF